MKRVMSDILNDEKSEFRGYIDLPGDISVSELHSRSHQTIIRVSEKIQTLILRVKLQIGSEKYQK